MTYQKVTSKNPTAIDVPALAKRYGAIATPLGPMFPRDVAGQYLREVFGVGSMAMLAKLALKPDVGPKFYKPTSSRSYYPIEDLHGWAIGRFGAPQTSFSKAKRKRNSATKSTSSEMEAA